MLRVSSFGPSGIVNVDLSQLDGPAFQETVALDLERDPRATRRDAYAPMDFTAGINGQRPAADLTRCRSSNHVSQPFAIPLLEPLHPLPLAIETTERLARDGDFPLGDNFDLARVFLPEESPLLHRK